MTAAWEMVYESPPDGVTIPPGGTWTTQIPLRVVPSENAVYLNGERLAPGRYQFALRLTYQWAKYRFLWWKWGWRNEEVVQPFSLDVYPGYPWAIMEVVGGGKRERVLP